MKKTYAIFVEFWNLNLLQIKNSRSTTFTLVFTFVIVLMSFIDIHVGMENGQNSVSEWDFSNPHLLYYISVLKILVFLLLTLQFCSFIETDMSSGMMFHRYSLGFSAAQQSILLIIYILFFTIIYHMIGCVIFDLRFALLWKAPFFYYIQNYGIIRLSNECIRMIILSLLATFIYLRTRKSSLTFIWLFFLWLAELILIECDKYIWAFSIYKFLPLHLLFSFDFLSPSVSLASLFAAIYCIVIALLFYISIKKTKETIILKHFK